MDGLVHGFDIGFTGISQSTLQKNLLSARQNAQGVDIAIMKELQRGHTSGPFSEPPFEVTHCSPIGAVLKKDNSCRLIMDLSQPDGLSINENINKEDFPVVYTPFDAATAMVREVGPGCFLSKVDVKHAFRLLPVLPECWHLLCYYWRDMYYVDTRLSFGLRSSPSIFNQFADLVCWIIQTIYLIVLLIHYADDFFLFERRR